MVHTQKHGLYGKARLAHRRSRAARVYAAQRVEEAFDPQAAFGRETSTSVQMARAGSSILNAGGAHSAGAAKPLQLELPLNLSTSVAVDSGIHVIPIGPPPSGSTRKSAPATHAKSIHLPTRLPTGGAKRFSLAWFVCGCLAGGAGAGVVLLVIQMLFR